MITDKDKIKMPPLFSKGCLTFKESKHTLVKNGDYYRCSLKTNGFCIKKSEKLINAKNLERRLGRLREKFLLPDDTAQIVFNKIMPINLSMLMKSGNNEKYIQQNLESTGNLMIADLQEGKTINKSDYLEFKRMYFELAKSFYSIILTGFLLDLLFTLIKRKSEQDEMNSYIDNLFKQKPRNMNHSFAMQIKKIYISNDGEIENIEFEGFSWFAFQYFKKLIPEYNPKIKEGFIVNTRKFNSLDYNEVIEEFIRNDLADTYSYNSFATKYAKEKLLEKIFGDFEKTPRQEKIDYLIKLNSPTKEAIIALISTILRN